MMANRSENTKNTACSEWEMQLAESLDGVLAPEKELSFQTHMTTCAACAELYEEARRGREWLGFLSEDPEIPEGLLERILMQSGPAAFNALTPAVAGTGMHMPPVWQQTTFMARASRFASRHFEPRLLMTAAMAFFSIALTLNLSGFRLDRIHMGWISPSYVRSIMERRVTAASTPLVRFYDHVRDSYEVDSKVRAIEKTSERFATPLKNESEQNDAVPEQQNNASPNSGADITAPKGDSTPAASPNVKPQSSAPEPGTQQSEPQKQSEPKAPVRQGTQFELPLDHQPAGTVNGSGDAGSTRQKRNSTEGEPLRLSTAQV
jgi:hypothetical protein